MFRSTYDARFYEELVPLESAYAVLAQRIVEYFKPESVCDFGCGTGYILTQLAESGVSVTGVEGSPTALDFVEASIKERIRIADLSKPLQVGICDLALSTEVAEHLPKKAARCFVSNVSAAAAKYVVFSAAAPGQWGDGHIKCQPKAYWIDLFREQGFRPEPQLTRSFVASLAPIEKDLPWIGNLIIFTRGEA